MAPKDVPDALVAHLVSQVLKRTHNPVIAPAPIFSGKLEDEALDFPSNPRPSRMAALPQVRGGRRIDRGQELGYPADSGSSPQGGRQPHSHPSRKRQTHSYERPVCQDRGRPRFICQMMPIGFRSFKKKSCSFQTEDMTIRWTRCRSSWAGQKHFQISLFLAGGQRLAGSEFFQRPPYMRP